MDHPHFTPGSCTISHWSGMKHSAKPQFNLPLPDFPLMSQAVLLTLLFTVREICTIW